MRDRNVFFVIVLCIAFLSLAQISSAQNSGDCPAIAQEAFEEVANNCAIPERNSACYGFPGVTALNVNDLPIPDFTQPSDHADLLNFQEVRTTPLNVAENEWGIAVTNIQANLPAGMPGQGGVFISMGDVRLENGVSADQALILPETALPLTTTTAAYIHNVPPDFDVAQEIVGAVASGTTLEADGVSPDGEWARIFFTYKTTFGISASAWVELSAFPDDVDLTSLPTIAPESLTPMQKFYLTNGTEAPGCAEIAPSMLYVQGPEEIELDFIVNDARIRLSSTILVRILPPGNLMQVIALSGIVILDISGDAPVVLAPGFFSIIPLIGPFDLGVDGRANDLTIATDGHWSTPALMNASELEALGEALNGSIPENVQYYDLGVPVLICASGVGSPVCEVQQPVSSARIAELCALGVLPPEICGQ